MRSRFKAFVLLILALCVFASSALAGYDTLEFGSRGSDVLKMQKALLALGFDPNGTDGKFGRGTESAVKLYQSSRGLEVDGKAGNQTLSRLYGESTGASSSSSSSQTSSSSTSLRYGDSGEAVLQMQQKLTQLGYSTNGVDGSFGAGTQKAVIAFQKASKLKADGVAGTQTLSALYAAQGSTSTSTSTSTGTLSGSGMLGSRTLRKGYTGSDVTQLQILLGGLGYYSGEMDGDYGTGTIAAVKAFQKKNGLTVDGLAGGNTISKLQSSSAIAASGSTSSSSTVTPPATSGTSGYSVLRSGATGQEVLNLQNRLVQLGYTLTVNGSYDRETKAAVLAFQKDNKLGADGAAGPLTQAALYSTNASGSSGSSGSSVTIDADTGKSSGPSTSQVQLLHWFNDVKPSVRTGQTYTIFDPATSLSWKLRFYSLGRHADSEPVTATDTAIMFKAFGNQNTWTSKPVYAQLPDGRWTVASMHNVPHLSGSIKDNDFNGHLCVHFLRDMSECELNDPDYGVQNQNTIRKKWKQLTGQDVEYR